MRPSTDRIRQERAVSEVVGYTLLTGLVVLGVSVVLLVGGPALLSSQAAMELGQAERSLTQFDSTAVRVITGSSGPQEIDLGLRGNRGTLDVDEDAGTIRVEYVKSFDNGNASDIIETSMGAVRYDNGDSTVAYQGGGVWRRDPNGSTMISPPEITLTDKTLRVPAVRLRDDGSVHTELQLASPGEPTQHYPNASAGYENKIGSGMVYVFVQSQYYKAWGQYFEEEIGGIVQYDHDREAVAVLLTGLPLDFSPEAGVIATSTSGEIRLEGTGAYVNSYDSRNGTYAETRGDQGIVKSAGEVSLFGDSQIDGDVDADTDIRIESGSAQIDGDAGAGDHVYPHDDSSVTGEIVNGTDGVSPIPPMDPLIDMRMRSLSSENDNNATDAISGTTLTLDAENELSAGEYYVDQIELADETLVLNATAGNITLGVENWITLYGSSGQDAPGNITVKGDHRVQVYTNASERNAVNIPGEGIQHLHFAVKKDASIRTVTDDRERGPQFQVLAPSTWEGAVAGSESKKPNVTGMMIAPGGPFGDSKFYVQHGHVFGSAVSGNVTLGQGGEIHFDRSIMDLTIPVGQRIPRVEYMYVTKHDLHVSEAD